MTMEKREETKQLSLQQKVARIRERIPALVKKTYSQEVNYDFVKIDDVYRYLAPAMNDYQVNLEVVSETATRKDELGNSIFVQYVAQSQMWMYEADLTLRWINAEDPQEADTVTIHAIGSHEFPDKAKGSAWTYALKYYLLNKFCIDQGGEDPDMRGLKTPKTEPEARPEPKPKESGVSKKGQPEAEAGKVEKEKKEMPAASGQTFRSQTAVEQEDKLPVFTTPEPVKKEKTSESGRPKAAGKQKPVQETDRKEGKTDQTTDSPKTLSSSAPPVSSHIKPENGTMVQLPESAKEEAETGSSMTIEEAMQIKCTPGTYSEHTLGSLAQMGEEGIQALIWYAEGYRGRRQELREGAKLILNAAKAA